MATVSRGANHSNALGDRLARLVLYRRKVLHAAVPRRDSGQCSEEGNVKPAVFDFCIRLGEAIRRFDHDHSALHKLQRLLDEEEFTNAATLFGRAATLY